MVRRGISRTGVLITIACVVLLAALLVPVLRERRRVRLALEEASRLVEIHEGMIFYADGHDGMYPVPGLIDRSADPFVGQIPGSGSESFRRNTTANVYSAMIALQFIGPPALVSPFERNPVVVVDDDYDHSAYDPTRDRYWDPTFVADLQTGSNASYGHTPLAGDRLQLAWRTVSNSGYAVVGGRGPADGVATADSYSCRADGDWQGHLVFGDNHVETLHVAAGNAVAIALGDNPFAFDDDLRDAIDQVVAFTLGFDDEGRPILQHD